MIFASGRSPRLSSASAQVRLPKCAAHAGAASAEPAQACLLRSCGRWARGSRFLGSIDEPKKGVNLFEEAFADEGGPRGRGWACFADWRAALLARSP